MAVNSGRTPKNAYRSNVYVQGNTAVRKQTKRELYELPQRKAEPERRTGTRKGNAVRRNREKALHMNVGYVVFLVCALVAAAFILTWYLGLQSDITNSIKNISRMESSLNELKLENDENYSRIDSSINLEEVKRIAIQELGMRYAEEGQIVTFSGEGSDYVRQTGEIPD